MVKVLKPEIREIVNRDLEILEYIANLAERYFKENFPSSPMEIVAQLKKSVLRELDFVKENGNIRTFRKDHEKEPSIVIPIVYEKYTRKGLLVMERIHGYKINDLESFAKKKMG